MKFVITWSTAAIDDLARIWTGATDQSAIAGAAEEIDRLLSRDPQFVGESRPGNQRVAFSSPLGFRFEVVVDDLRVTVGSVWPIRQV